MDKFLSEMGLKWDDLDTPGHSGEREELLKRFNGFQQEAFTIDNMKDYILSMRSWTEQELVKHRDVSHTWLSVVCFFIPIIGIIRKWYQDQYEGELKARLANYIGLQQMLETPEKRRKQLKQDLEVLAKSMKRG